MSAKPATPAKPHALWPWSPIVATLVLLNTTTIAQAFEDEWRDRRLETQIGMASTSDGERAVGFRRDSDYRRIETNSIYGSTLATAIGNQINKGNQPTVTVIGDDYEDIVDEARNDFERRC